MTDRRLWLFSESLLSKWGFNDGDLPDEVDGWLDAQDPPIHLAGNWRPILCQLVRRYLIPALDQAVEVVEIETSHNPIRAEKVDGVDVTDSWYHNGEKVRLTPDSVTVPYSAILELIQGETI